MTPNILEAMKFPFNVGDYTWFDLQSFDGPEEEHATMERAKAMGLPEVLHDDYLPKDLPMPFEKLALARRTKKGTVLATTYERIGNDMLVTLRISARKFVCWFRHHGDIEPPALNLEHQMDDDLYAKMGDALKMSPEAIAAGVDSPEKVLTDFKNGIKLLYWHMLLSMMNKQATASAYTPVPNPANERRIRKGKRPIFEWKVIDVSAKRVLPSGPTGKTHASPRRHKRRGHLRTYKNGKTVWIKEMMVGKIEFGYIHHSYTKGETPCPDQ